MVERGGGQVNPEIVRVLLIKRGDGWAAQVLEFDIAAQGRSIPQAMHGRDPGSKWRMGTFR